MDIGFSAAGIDVVWANDFDKSACDTYAANKLGDIEHGDINLLIPSLKKFKNQIDIVFGGPPCQGFSVAGKMDPNDERSQLVWSYLRTVELLKPRAFVLENVKSLAVNDRFKIIRNKLISEFENIGYSVSLQVLVASDYGVPQKRERMFLVGVQKGLPHASHIAGFLNMQRKPGKSVRQTIGHLPPPGEKGNDLVCNAGITLASSPILRKSPYAGMLFNGLGRPLNLNRPSTTLPASMGGNKTHIIDQKLLKNPRANDWISAYHAHLMDGGEPYDWKSAPDHLRRLTVKEALLLQSFPEDFIIKASRTSAYRLIGNAVPCELARSVASAVTNLLNANLNEIKEANEEFETQDALPLFSKRQKKAA